MSLCDPLMRTKRQGPTSVSSVRSPSNEIGLLSHTIFCAVREVL